MSNIPPFAAGSYASDRQTANLVKLKGQLAALTTQLTTGQSAQSYGGLGAGRTTSLSARAAISALDGYTAAITAGTTRVSLASAGLTQLSTLSDTVQRSITAYLSPSSSTLLSTVGSIAGNSLDAAIDALNQSAAGQYIFAGRDSDNEPVIDSATMLNGDASKGLVGLKALIAEQKTADLGPNGDGRLTPTASGSTVTLTEDGSAEARANFGFSLLSAKSSNTSAISATPTAATAANVDVAFASQPAAGDRVRVALLQSDGSQKIVDLTATTSADGGANTFKIDPGGDPAVTAANLKAALGTGAQIASVQSASPPGISASFTGGSPASASLAVNGTPAAGDTVTVTVGLHDGSTQTITLTAAATAAASSTTSFAIGATPAATAANLSAALTNALKNTAQTALSASSALRASQNFFDGSSSAGLAPRRVSADGNGYAETASTGTVIWYKGDDTSPDARSTATLQVGATQTVQVGAQANEAPIKGLLASLAAVSAEGSVNASDTVATTRYAALAQKANTLIIGSKEGLTQISADFSRANSTMTAAKSNAAETKVTLQNAIDGVEGISTEEVMVKLLDLQTQLQASYQLTSKIAQLSLVNYMS
ncbi:hypothetical protein MMB17_07165 [Methylobacterium organophilum]|uniref:flagellin n=1 Tax=Methylobacterium organophilum TaxID=410 RepID=UPI001F12C612|nr:flagellin [Methylobacterium organophilum]UMY19071.1 hypothetical protein MMB17_07165 [Methylobacterium organophilum]